MDYINEILDDFDELDPTSSRTKSSGVLDIPFKFNKDCKNAFTKQVVDFHHLVAKILFATKRSRQDTCTAVSFLATIVRDPYYDNWTYLVHLIKYIRGTRNIPFILSANVSNILKW